VRWFLDYEGGPDKATKMEAFIVDTVHCPPPSLGSVYGGLSRPVPAHEAEAHEAE
jgi:hypothetical protein